MNKIRKITPVVLLAIRTRFLGLFGKNQIDALKLVSQGFLAQQNKYLVYLGLILIALSIAGFNLVSKNQTTVSAKENSLLVDLLFTDRDNIEIVKNDIAANPNLKGSSYVSFVSVASASSNAGLISNKPIKTGNKKAVKTSETKILTKNTSSVTEVKKNPSIQKYVVQDGDTISELAWKFGVDAATILQENDLYGDDIIKSGMELNILPISGTSEKVDTGETLIAIARKHGVSVDEVMKYNKFVTASDIEVGQSLIIPDGNREIKERPKPEPDPVVLAAATSDVSSTSDYEDTSYNETQTVTSTQPTSRNDLRPTNNAFSWGWCTWYAAARRPDVTWMGNAGEWLGNAQAQGRATGRVPAVGAILVTNESWWGHVAIVEAVNGNSVTISEMNYAGFGVISSRTISNGSGVIKGYIY